MEVVTYCWLIHRIVFLQKPTGGNNRLNRLTFRICTRPTFNTDWNFNLVSSSWHIFVRRLYRMWRTTDWHTSDIDQLLRSTFINFHQTAHHQTTIVRRIASSIHSRTWEYKFSKNRVYSLPFYPFAAAQIQFTRSSYTSYTSRIQQQLGRWNQ